MRSRKFWLPVVRPPEIDAERVVSSADLTCRPLGVEAAAQSVNAGGWSAPSYSSTESLIW
jgi:hypothetical protein